MAPSPQVTFMFTDIEGSTALWDDDADAMRVALEEHDRRIRAVAADRDGRIFAAGGDGFAIAFGSAADAASAAAEMQLAMNEPIGPPEIRIRIGVHTGSASERDGDYFGPAVNRCARLTDAGHGGQILASAATIEALDGIELGDIEIVDLGVHKLRDLAEPERIHQLETPGLPREFARLRTVSGPADAIPTQLTSFVGRERELIDVGELVEEHRLVTLSGPGGAGKTRLAMQAAEALLAEFPDGLRLAELAAITDDEVLVDEIAQRFGVTSIVGESLRDTLAAAIGDRRMLLILDNCEHIVDEVAGLVHHLLTRSPNLRLIATSRQRLGIGGEAVYRVPPLSMPGSPGGVDGALQVGVEEALTFDSVRLFVDRACLADVSFELTRQNVGDVTAICRRLDGIPLAIELAAARTRSMAPAQIGARLDERFRLLTTTDRSADVRQQTLWRAIEWSHDLLSEDERAVFRRIGAIASNFALDAAEGVGAGGSIDELDVMELLAALVDKSMVSTVVGRDGATRYQLLESVKQFAAAQLDATGEYDDASERAAQHFAQVSERLRSQVRERSLAEALAVMDEEEDNIRAGLRFALDTDRTLLAARLVGGLGYLWYTAGTHREGLQWCDELFQTDASTLEQLPDEVRADAMHSLALMLAVSGQPKRGIDVLIAQVEIRRRLGQPARLAGALNNLGNLLFDVGDRGGAEPVLREAIDLYRKAGESPAMSLTSLGYAAAHAGRIDEAEQLYLEAIAAAKESGASYDIAVTTGGLGRWLARSDRPRAARAHLLEARERFEELGSAPGISDADLSFAIVERAEGHPAEAAHRLLMALTAPGERWYDEFDAWTMQIAASVLDDFETASVLIGAVANRYEQVDAPQSTFDLRDLDITSKRLHDALGEADFGRCSRAGSRRSRPETTELTTQALRSFIEHHSTAAHDR